MIRVLGPQPTPPLDLERARERLRALLVEETAACAIAEAQPGACEGAVRFESSRTAYHWGDKTKPDPNAPVPLCRFHAKEHHDYWDEQWESFRTGLM
jgi:hypothetical protein